MHIRDSVSHWLAQQSPYALVTAPNPVFDYELRRVGKPDHEIALKKHRASIVWGLILLCIAAWFFDPRGSILGLLFLPASLIIALVSDMYYMILTVEIISQQMASGEWEMLCLTPLLSRDILAAKYAIVQLRLWRVMSVEIVMRVGGTVLGMAALIVSLFSHGLLGDMLNSATLVLVLFFVIFATVYTLEPLWRMRAVVALGLAISVQVRNSIAATLAGFAALLVMRLFQLVILMTVSFVAAPVLAFLSSWPTPVRDGNLADLLVYVLACLVAGGGVYMSYKILEDSALKRAAWFAFRIE